MTNLMIMCANQRELICLFKKTRALCGCSKDIRCNYPYSIVLPSIFSIRFVIWNDEQAIKNWSRGIRNLKQVKGYDFEETLDELLIKRGEAK